MQEPDIITAAAPVLLRCNDRYTRLRHDCSPLPLGRPFSRSFRLDRRASCSAMILSSSASFNLSVESIVLGSLAFPFSLAATPGSVAFQPPFPVSSRTHPTDLLQVCDLRVRRCPVPRAAADTDQISHRQISHPSPFPALALERGASVKNLGRQVCSCSATRWQSLCFIPSSRDPQQNRALLFKSQGCSLGFEKLPIHL